MDAKSFLLVLVLMPTILKAWKSSTEDERLQNKLRRHTQIHTQSKRHMLPLNQDLKRRSTTQKPREFRKKPSGHLTPLEDDDIENDEVFSVAIGPPPARPKYDRTGWKTNSHKHIHNYNHTTDTENSAAALIKNILTQLGREFLLYDVNENFVFGQYVGNAMKNLTGDLRMKMQHDILDVIVKYQKLNRGEEVKSDEKFSLPKNIKLDKKNDLTNDTEEGWSDFTNLAKIVG